MSNRNELKKKLDNDRAALRDFTRSARGRLNEIREREAQEELDAIQLEGERRYRRSVLGDEAGE